MKLLLLAAALLCLIPCAALAENETPVASSGQSDQPLVATCAIPAILGVNVPLIEAESAVPQFPQEDTSVVTVKTFYTR